MSYTYGRLRVFFDNLEECAHWQKLTGRESFGDCLWVDEHEDTVRTIDPEGKTCYYGDFSLHAHEKE